MKINFFGIDNEDESHQWLVDCTVRQPLGHGSAIFFLLSSGAAKLYEPPKLYCTKNQQLKAYWSGNIYGSKRRTFAVTEEPVRAQRHGHGSRHRCILPLRLGHKTETSTFFTFQSKGLYEAKEPDPSPMRHFNDFHLDECSSCIFTNYCYVQLIVHPQFALCLCQVKHALPIKCPIMFY